MDLVADQRGRGWRGRPAWAEINLDAIEHNVRAIRAELGDAVELLAVVKANGYGHGAVPVAKAILRAGASRLGVAFVEEALQLRHAGITAPILVLGYVPPWQARESVAESLSVTVNSWQTALALSAYAVSVGATVNVHLKVDTGLGRFGLLPAEIPEFARGITSLPGMRLEGLWTHFASADEPDKSYTRSQLEVLLQTHRALTAAGNTIPLLHAANSAAALSVPETRLSMVRCGLAIYGLYPEAGTAQTVHLKPAMSLKASLVRVRQLPAGSPVSYGRTYVTTEPTLVGLVPFGYADGFSRRRSNLGYVLVAGRRVPVIGRVCMDQFSVDLRDIPTSRQEDEVVIMGRQGEDEISAEEIADWTGTINYEVVSDINARVPRVYLQGGRVVSVDSISGAGNSGEGS